MRLRVKDMDIATGRVLVATLNEKDAEKLDINALDRIKVKKGRNTETVVVNIAEGKIAVPKGKIGVSEGVVDSLKLKKNDIVDIALARKPLSISHIKKKLDGQRLSKKEINQIVWDIVNNKLSGIEIAYFVSACYTHRLTLNETVMLTKAMVGHGDILKLDKYPIIDKHCIGGVPGNRTTIVLVPIIAAAGLTMPKTSSRSITSPAGTADTMEVLANVSLSIKEMKRIVNKIGCSIVWGGALNLAPADDKIIQVERPLGIDAESQLLASIMAKKHSVSSTHIIIDIPVGKGAKIEKKKDAQKLKKEFEAIGKKLKKHIKVVITNGSQPIGNGIGPALEARDVLWLLKRDYKAPLDLERKCIILASETFRMAGIKDGRKKALEILNSGKAYKKMKEIIKIQGGNPNINPDKIKLGRYSFTIKSSKNSVVRDIDNIAVSKIARVAGAPFAKGAGIYLYKHAGKKVKRGEILFTVYAESKERLKYAKDVLKKLNPFVLK
jgi:AMP phosphorylase